MDFKEAGFKVIYLETYLIRKFLRETEALVARSDGEMTEMKGLNNGSERKKKLDYKEDNLIDITDCWCGCEKNF